MRQTGRVYCSLTCSKAYRAKVSSETMARTNRKYASARMTLRNPMKNDAARAKMTATLRERKYAPSQPGGNGRPATEAESVLSLLFSDLGFVPQLAIRTGMKRGSGYPPAYKPDCAHPVLMIALEADGASHGTLARQVQDAKKDALLKALGWSVSRFTNRQILEDPASVVETVMSIISKCKTCTPTRQTA
jgi:hypothetical protein